MLKCLNPRTRLEELRQHGRLINQRSWRFQKDVVCKKRKMPVRKSQAIENSVPCRQPSCCLQDSPAAVSGPASSVSGDFILLARGGPGDISTNSQGSPCAISVDCASRPPGTPDQRRSSAGDNRSG